MCERVRASVVDTSNSSDLRIMCRVIDVHTQCNILYVHAHGFVCEWHVNASLSLSLSIALFDVQQRWCGKRVMKYRPHSIIICVLNFGICAWAVAVAVAATAAALCFFFSVLFFAVILLLLNETRYASTHILTNNEYTYTGIQSFCFSYARTATNLVFIEVLFYRLL